LKYKSILVVIENGESFRELNVAVLRVRKRGAIPVKGEAFQERFGAIFQCDLTRAACFRGFGWSKGECFRGMGEADFGR
jgi:hypothetical protein